jgi:hypothetical protein
MAVRRLVSYAFAVALFAVAVSVAFGDPPPHGPVEPGIAVAGSL